MNYKLSFIISLLFGICIQTSAQRVTVEQDVVDLGQVLFQSPATAEFILKNKGGDRLSIRQVRTSCGCTTVTYPHEEIPAGQQFKISAVYDAQTMGHFQKQVALYTTSSSQPVVLTLRGVVVEELVDYSGDYPYSIGQLRTDCNEIEFDDVNSGELPVKKIHIINASDKTSQPVLMHLPAYLSAQVSPSRIPPGKSGVATIILHSDKLRDFGLTQTTIYLGENPGDKVSQEKSINVSAILLPSNFNQQFEENQPSPKIRISTTNLQLSQPSNKNKRKGEITIENIGTAPLEISRLQMFTLGLQLSLSAKTIDPGKSAKLKISGDIRQLKSLQNKPRVLIITNDPQHPKIIINISLP